ncbi:hypothetical protein GCM10009560_59610 [Nonomuraea longicatena]|uniref:Uncharacterized protein n=1 Tax=Nonomuraea longicatena TaxID=83682 RepID=A0ABP4B286_9ACTN
MDERVGQPGGRAVVGGPVEDDQLLVEGGPQLVRVDSPLRHATILPGNYGPVPMVSEIVRLGRSRAFIEEVGFVHRWFRKPP